MVANQLYELCEAVGPEPTRYFFIALMYSYLCMHSFTYIFDTEYSDCNFTILILEI